MDFCRKLHMHGGLEVVGITENALIQSNPNRKVAECPECHAKIAAGPPKNTCTFCWLLWCHINPSRLIEARHLRSILHRLLDRLEDLETSVRKMQSAKARAAKASKKL